LRTWPGSCSATTLRAGAAPRAGRACQPPGAACASSLGMGQAGQQLGDLPKPSQPAAVRRAGAINLRGNQRPKGSES